MSTDPEDEAEQAERLLLSYPRQSCQRLPDGLRDRRSVL